MVTNIAPISKSSSTRFFVGHQRNQLAHRRKCSFVAASLRQDDHALSSVGPSDGSSPACNRRRALLGLAAGLSALTLGPINPAPTLAKGADKKETTMVTGPPPQPLLSPPVFGGTVINDPAALRAQLEAQYTQWSSGQFDTWLAAQSETLKWLSSYNGVDLKLKGKAGAKQYFSMLNADLDIQSYKPLAIFVDNDGDEATVVVEATGVSRRTQQSFKTIFLHAYTVGPMGQILKFKETTDTALMAQLVPPPPPSVASGASTGVSGGVAAAGGSAPAVAPLVSAGGAAMERSA